MTWIGYRVVETDPRNLSRVMVTESLAEEGGLSSAQARPQKPSLESRSTDAATFSPHSPLDSAIFAETSSLIERGSSIDGEAHIAVLDSLIDLLTRVL